MPLTDMLDVFFDGSTCLLQHIKGRKCSTSLAHLCSMLKDCEPGPQRSGFRFQLGSFLSPLLCVVLLGVTKRGKSNPYPAIRVWEHWFHKIDGGPPLRHHEGPCLILALFFFTIAFQEATVTKVRSLTLTQRTGFGYMGSKN